MMMIRVGAEVSKRQSSKECCFCVSVLMCCQQQHHRSHTAHSLWSMKAWRSASDAAVMRLVSSRLYWSAFSFWSVKLSICVSWLVTVILGGAPYHQQQKHTKRCATTPPVPQPSPLELLLCLEQDKIIHK